MPALLLAANAGSFCKSCFRLATKKAPEWKVIIEKAA